jgi:hypothetical protein
MIVPFAAEQLDGSVALELPITGTGFTITLVVLLEKQVPKLAMTLYVPLAAVVMFERLGLGNVLVKPLGPVQLYATPEVLLLAERFKVPPAQRGLLLVMIGCTGVGFTVTEVVAEAELQPFCIDLTL